MFAYVGREKQKGEGKTRKDTETEKLTLVRCEHVESLQGKSEVAGDTGKCERSPNKEARSLELTLPTCSRSFLTLRPVNGFAKIAQGEFKVNSR